MRIATTGAALVLAAILSGPAARAEAPKPLQPLAFLLGTWNGIGGGKPGEGTGVATFALGLQDRVIVRTSYAQYPGSASAPASRHDDLMVIHVGRDGLVRADYYDSEGHDIRYDVRVDAPGHASFVSQAVAGEPRYRLTYALAPGGDLKGRFEIAPPGKPEAFAPYLVWDSRKSSPPADGKRP